MIHVFGSKADLARLEEIETAKDDQRLDELYRTVCGSFEQQWKAWAARSYKAEYEDPSKRQELQPPFIPIERGQETEDDDDGKKEDPKKKKRRRR
jgi:hypothetical protein